MKHQLSLSASTVSFSSDDCEEEKASLEEAEASFDIILTHLHTKYLSHPALRLPQDILLNTLTMLNLEIWESYSFLS